jgi:predicted DsbA family dithiol-disulfide isomerase
MMAIESPMVTADVIEAMEFPDMAAKYMVRGVPKTIINEVEELEGAHPEQSVLSAVLRAAGDQ